MIGGADCSNVNGAISLASLKVQYGLSFVFLKATEGLDFRDPLFPVFWEAARELGLARGAYHFAHPGQDPGKQADTFLAYAWSCGLHDPDMVALDLEVSDGRPPSAVSAWGRAFCAAVHSMAGRPVIAYTFRAFAEQGNCAGLGGYPLWIADPSSAPGTPRVPAPWKTWSVHQYSQQGIDLDVAAYPDAAAMTAALGVPHSPKPAPPEPEDDAVNISPLALSPYQPGGKTAAVTVDLGSAGTYKAVGFSSDWPLAGQAQPVIRVAVHSYAHGWTQITDVTLPASGKAVLTFSALDVDYMSVARASDSEALVSVGT